jgi:hypothetical protein
MGGRGSGGRRSGAGRKSQTWHENQDANGAWASPLGAEMLAIERARRAFAERVRTQGLELVRRLGDATAAAAGEFSRVTGLELAFSQVGEGFVVESGAGEFFRVTPNLAEAPQRLTIETNAGTEPAVGFVDDGALRLNVDGEMCTPAGTARRVFEPWLRRLNLSTVAEPVARNRMTHNLNGTNA